jgi:uncharacterized protein (DUF433 family)
MANGEWRMAMGGADAVRPAAGDRSAYASGVAYERISIDPNRMSGLPCIRDTRVTVSAVLGQLAAGLTIPELLVDFPYLDRADVLAALEFAAAAVQERKLRLARWPSAPCVSLSAPTCHRRLPFLAFASRQAVVKLSIGVGSTLYHAMDSGFGWADRFGSGYRRSARCARLRASCRV